MAFGSWIFNTLFRIQPEEKSTDIAAVEIKRA